MASTKTDKDQDTGKPTGAPTPAAKTDGVLDAKTLHGAHGNNKTTGGPEGPDHVAKGPGTAGLEGESLEHGKSTAEVLRDGSIVTEKGKSYATEPAQLESGGPHVTEMTQEEVEEVQADGRRGKRRARGEGPGRTARPLYICFDPAAEKDGVMQPTLVSRRSDEVLNHIDQNRTFKYLRVMAT